VSSGSWHSFCKVAFSGTINGWTNGWMDGWMDGWLSWQRGGIKNPVAGL